MTTSARRNSPAIDPTASHGAGVGVAVAVVGGVALGVTLGGELGVLVVGAGAGGALVVGVGVSDGVWLGVVGVLSLVLTLGVGDGLTLSIGLGETTEAGLLLLLLFSSITKITMPAAISTAPTTRAAMSDRLSRSPGGPDVSSTSAAGAAIGT